MHAKRSGRVFALILLFLLSGCGGNHSTERQSINLSLKEQLEAETRKLNKPISQDEAGNIFMKYVPNGRQVIIEYDHTTDDGMYLFRYFNFVPGDEGEEGAGISSTIDWFGLNAMTGAISSESGFLDQ